MADELGRLVSIDITDINQPIDPIRVSGDDIAGRVLKISYPNISNPSGLRPRLAYNPAPDSNASGGYIEAEQTGIVETTGRLTAYFTLPRAIYRNPHGVLAFQLCNDDMVVATRRITVIVEPPVVNADGGEAYDGLTDLHNAVAIAKDAKNNVDTLITDANARFDSTISNANTQLDSTISNANSRLDSTISDANNRLDSTISDASNRLDSTISEADTRLNEEIENVRKKTTLTASAETLNPNQTPTAFISNVGPDSLGNVNIGIPRAARVGATMTTLDSDTEGYVNTTTDENGDVTLSLGVPRGLTGAKGDKGEKGEKGNAGDVATEVTAGCVIPGEGLSVDTEGHLSVRWDGIGYCDRTLNVGDKLYAADIQGIDKNSLPIRGIVVSDFGGVHRITEGLKRGEYVVESTFIHTNGDPSFIDANNEGELKIGSGWSVFRSKTVCNSGLTFNTVDLIPMPKTLPDYFLVLDSITGKLFYATPDSPGSNTVLIGKEVGVTRDDGADIDALALSGSGFYNWSTPNIGMRVDSNPASMIKPYGIVYIPGQFSDGIIQSTSIITVDNLVATRGFFKDAVTGDTNGDISLYFTPITGGDTADRGWSTFTANVKMVDDFIGSNGHTLYLLELSQVVTIELAPGLYGLGILDSLSNLPKAASDSVSDSPDTVNVTIVPGMSPDKRADTTGSTSNAGGTDKSQPTDSKTDGVTTAGKTDAKPKPPTPTEPTVEPGSGLS